ncbi:endonuclease V [Rhodobacter phage RcSimone-Hastad]|nr:endonuclease V [Rhodobacter phage RcSimone-Hastad]
MTRINLVPPEELSRQHLVAEYRELPRIFALVRAAQGKGLKPANLKAPTTYVLGRGHMLFFYDKCMFLLRRQQSLIREMRRRGYDPKFDYPNDLIVGLEQHWLGDYEPTNEARALNRARIKERS